MKDVHQIFLNPLLDALPGCGNEDEDKDKDVLRKVSEVSAMIGTKGMSQSDQSIMEVKDDIEQLMKTQSCEPGYRVCEIVI